MLSWILSSKPHGDTNALAAVGKHTGYLSKIVPERGRSHKEGPPHRGRILTGTPLGNAQKVLQGVRHEGPQ